MLAWLYCAAVLALSVMLSSALELRSTVLTIDVLPGGWRLSTWPSERFAEAAKRENSDQRDL